MERLNLSKTKVGIGLTVGAGFIALGRAIHRESQSTKPPLQPVSTSEIDLGEATKFPIYKEDITEIPRRPVLEFIFR